ncbi:MAG: hypothetical protein QM791_00555 [Ferruginibacter sp.]
MRQIFMLFLFVTCGMSMCGQRPGDSFIGFDSRCESCSNTLRFVSDSLLAMEYPPDPVEGVVLFGMGYFYVSTDSSVAIYKYCSPADPHCRDTSKTVFHKIINGLINYTDSVLYVKIPADSGNYERFNRVTYIIDGKFYYQKMMQVHHRGRIQLDFTENQNKELQQELLKINSHKEKYNIKTYRGIGAYQKFGIEYAHGVTVITTKPARI